MTTLEVTTATHTDLLAETRKEVHFWFDMADVLFPSYVFKRPSVNLNLKGRTAGKAFIGKFELRINEVLLRENFDKFKVRTIPHEVAHFVAHVITMGRGKPHGWEWQKVMRQFGCETSVCHKYDVTNSAVKGKQARSYRYKCSCREMMFTQIRHRRSVKNGGDWYHCTKCKTKLIYSP